jgi:thiamine biosynthesis lipoprotein
MGTVVSFDVPDAARADGSLDSAIRWLHWVDQVFSPYRADSEVTRLADGEVTVGACVPEMAEVIAACAAVSELSGGYFTDTPNGRFDPSGYVKGWAAERAAAMLSAAGSNAHLVNAGGDVQCVGGRPASNASTANRADVGESTLGRLTDPCRTGPWRVGIADPFHPGGLALVVEAIDCAVATSGIAERGRHIITPDASRPAAGVASLTVIGPSLALADAYATAAVAMGPDLARDWTESLDGYAAYAILESGQTWQTARFDQHVSRAR